jgi:plastocyanin domain-containing protein
MDKVLSVVISLPAIGFIVWWFFGKRRDDVRMADEVNGVQQVEITVDGGYQPRVIQLKAGLPAKLSFIRRDPSTCLEEIVMPDFGISKSLPVGQKTVIEISPNKPGNYKYTCGMQMFSGQVVVK